MKIIATLDAPAAIGPYVQGKIVNGLLYASGQIPLNPLNGEIVGDSIETQTEQVMKNISAILKEAHSDFDLVIKTTCFLKNIEDFSRFNAIYLIRNSQRVPLLESQDYLKMSLLK